MISVESRGFRPLLSLGDTDDILIDFTQRYGQWTHGDYLKGYSKTQKRIVMVKIIDLEKFPLPRTCLDTEIAFLQRLQHSPYVVKLLEHKYYDTNLTTAVDVCNKGNLRDFMKEHGPFPEDKAVNFLLQLIAGLKGLHDIHFSLGALSPESILVHQENNKITLKLSNFLYAHPYTLETIDRSLLVSDLRYMPLEVLESSKYHLKSDLWSLGIIYYEMLYGAVPWTGNTPKKIEENIFNKPLEFPSDENISQTSINFISQCLQRDLDKRMDWADMMQHRLISKALFSGGNKVFHNITQEFSTEGQKQVPNICIEIPAKEKYFFSSKSLGLPSHNSASFVKRQKTLDLSTSKNSVDLKAEEAKKKQKNQSVLVVGKIDSSPSRPVTSRVTCDQFSNRVATESRNTIKGNYATSRNEGPVSSRQSCDQYGKKDVSENSITGFPLKLNSSTSVKRRTGASRLSYDENCQNSLTDSQTMTISSKMNSSTLKSERPVSSRVSYNPISARKEPKLQGAKLYESLVSKIGTTDDFHQVKAMNIQKTPYFDMGNSPVKKESKWLSCKADVLGETYELMAKRKEHVLCRKINKVLADESKNLGFGVVSAKVKLERFNSETQEKKKATLNSARSELLTARSTKFNDSKTKKQKSKEIYEILEEITSMLLKDDKIQASAENLIKLAANLKFLREFDEIGENVMKELKKLKDILIVFYRKKELNHLKYMLLVKNYV